MSTPETNPRWYRSYSKDAVATAEFDARLLSRKHPGVAFWVLIIEGVYVVNDIEGTLSYPVTTGFLNGERLDTQHLPR